MSSLTIIVLCHNRPDFARQTLHSILAQSDGDFDLVVSDNSSNDDVAQMIAAEFPQLDYRRRIPMLAPLAHFNRCIDEVQSDLFCLFHDDDLMQANFVQTMRPMLDKYPGVIACACNALVETMGKVEPHTSFRALGKLEWIGSPRNFAQRYFARAQSGIAPFPGYVYRRCLIGEVRLPLDGGKYSDVTWLLNLAMKAPILWVTTPLMTYRMHGGNDGSTESLRDRLRFLGFLKHSVNVLGNDLLSDYRCSFIYKRMASSNATSPARRRLARAFLKHYGWFRYMNPNLYGALIKRALIKRLAK